MTRFRPRRSPTRWRTPWPGRKQELRLKENARKEAKDRRASDQQRLSELARELHKKELRELNEKLSIDYSKMRNFIRTEAEPEIFYLPAKHNGVTKRKLADTEMLIERKLECLKQIDESELEAYGGPAPSPHGHSLLGSPVGESEGQGTVNQQQPFQAVPEVSDVASEGTGGAALYVSPRKVRRAFTLPAKQLKPTDRFLYWVGQRTEAEQDILFDGIGMIDKKLFTTFDTFLKEQLPIPGEEWR
mmetsp:Transcript_19139/g.46155  ORF Transcript_19139/g.46155 Transcript_19139/m.46155 type:complete len:245 (-) Transcript_19139:255-989(-)